MENEDTPTSVTITSVGGGGAPVRTPIEIDLIAAE